MTALSPHRSALRATRALGLVLILCVALPLAARAADRDRLEAFLNVTGFDVALESIRLTAGAAPIMLGMDPGAFGSDWTRMTDEVFDPEVTHELALDILEQTLSDELLTHAAGFYASDLGQRLVVAENASHMVEDDAAKQEEGRALIAAMQEADAPRLALIERMNDAIGGEGHAARALNQIQLRFLLAASAAGVITLRMDPEDLAAMMRQQEGEMRRDLRASGLAASAWTYRDFTDDEIEAYAEALEHPSMRQVYELMNAVQYELMANRFELLAARMAELHPGQEL